MWHVEIKSETVTLLYNYRGMMGDNCEIVDATLQAVHAIQTNIQTYVTDTVTPPPPQTTHLPPPPSVKSGLRKGLMLGMLATETHIVPAGDAANETHIKPAGDAATEAYIGDAVYSEGSEPGSPGSPGQIRLGGFGEFDNLGLEEDVSMVTPGDSMVTTGDVMVTPNNTVVTPGEMIEDLMRSVQPEQVKE